MKTDPPTPPNRPISAPKPGQRPQQRKVFDVMRPGKAPASPTSRPVVIGHKPKAQAAQTSVSGIGEAHKDGLFDGHKKVAITPVHDDVPVAAAETPAPSPVHVSVARAEPEPTSSVDTSAPPKKPVEKPAPVEPVTPAEPETPEADDSASPTPQDEEKLTEAAMEPEPPAPPAAEHPAEPLPQEDRPKDDDPVHDIAPPSLEGQVVVSHHTTEPRGTGRLIGLIVLMLLFAVIVLDILLDVGIISSSAIPHTHLF